MWQDLCGLSEPWFGGSEYRIPEPSTPRRIDADTSNVTLQALANAENDQYIKLFYSYTYFRDQFYWPICAGLSISNPVFPTHRCVLSRPRGHWLGMSSQYGCDSPKHVTMCADSQLWSWFIIPFWATGSSLTVQDYKYELETFRASPVHQFIG